MTALSEAQVALVMGSAFGAEGYARLSFATDLQTLERGFDALSQFLEADNWSLHALRCDRFTRKVDPCRDRPCSKWRLGIS